MRILFVLLTFIHVNVQAQSEEDKVKTVISSLFEGMKRSDSNMIRSAFAPGALMQTVARNKEGQNYIHTDNITDFIAAISKPHNEVYDERITFDLVRIDKDLSIVWTPYKFYIGEKFSHCGVNSFQLVQLNKKWKIQYIIDTRYRDNCQ